ncbi:MAG TPA: acyloxyacyl hydrolase, partial [Bacteroidales bacterium]
EKKWNNYYNYPRLGIGFYHSGLGNNEIFGQVNAVFGYFDRYFFPLNSRFNLGNRISFGVSYITKKFDLDNNYFDVAIGSNLNVYINYCLEGLVRVSPQMQMKLGLGMTHVSNGRFREPNKGLNLVTSFVGIQYSLSNPSKFILAQPKETDEPGKNQLILMGITGEKQISRRYSYSFWPTALSTEFAHKISRTSWLGAALTVYNDPSLKKEIELDGDTARKGDDLRITLNASYELKMGRFSTLFQPGIYLKNGYTKPGMISNKIGLRYQLNRHWLTSVAIKAHWFAIADFIEFGVGYRWHY